jgi:hypothetical protein
MQKEDIEEMYNQKKIDWRVVQVTARDGTDLLDDPSKTFTIKTADENLKAIRQVLSTADPYKKSKEK